jgi:DNA-binding transcriptional ArsR family regulator
MRPGPDHAPRPALGLLSHPGQVLLCIARDPGIRLRELAVATGLTERAVLRLIGELETAKLLSRTREGRRNRYRIHLERPLEHPLEQGRSVGDLVALWMKPPGQRTR